MAEWVRYNSSTSKWESRYVETNIPQTREELQGPGNIFFVAKSPSEAPKELREWLQRIIPKSDPIWSTRMQRMNGYFKSSPSHEPAYSSFRYLSKHIKDLTPSGSFEYGWHEMDFVCLVENDSLLLVCFGLPLHLQTDLRVALRTTIGKATTLSFCLVHQTILDCLVGLLDDAIWSTRNFVRQAEEHRPGYAKQSIDFYWLHEGARQTIHVSEMLKVAQETSKALHAELSARLLHEKIPTTESAPILTSITFDIQQLHSLGNRAESNYLRLQNEISMAFNMIAQRDTQATVTLSEAASRDSDAMKQIAFVSLLLLPATFVSALFSMSFFNYDPHGGGWTVSKSFWIYWVVSVPLTGVVYALWTLRSRSTSPQHQPLQRINMGNK